jgi:hypothetical protein
MLKPVALTMVLLLIPVLAKADSVWTYRVMLVVLPIFRAARRL